MEVVVLVVLVVHDVGVRVVDCVTLLVERFLNSMVEHFCKRLEQPTRI